MSRRSQSLQQPTIIEKINCRLSIFGAGHAGKTKIVERLLRNRFIDDYQQTVEDYHEILYDFSGISLTLEIVDTSGTYQFPGMRKLNIERSNLIFLVYDVTDKESFLEVKRLYEITRGISTDINIIIVGSKSDLFAGSDSRLFNNEIYGKDTVTKFVDSTHDKNLVHRMCSAKTGQGIELIIETGLTCLYPCFAKQYGLCTATFCRFLNQHNFQQKEHNRNSHYGFRCMYKQMSSFVKEKTQF